MNFEVGDMIMIMGNYLFKIQYSLLRHDGRKDSVLCWKLGLEGLECGVALGLVRLVILDYRTIIIDSSYCSSVGIEDGWFGRIDS